MGLFKVKNQQTQTQRTVGSAFLVERPIPQQDIEAMRIKKEREEQQKAFEIEKEQRIKEQEKYQAEKNTNLEM